MLRAVFVRSLRAAGDLAATPGDLWRVAVSAEGRRAAQAPVLDDLLATWPAGVVPLLDHAGPAAATWSLDRPLGPAAIKESQTDRLPRVLDDEGWGVVIAGFAAAAQSCRRRGLRPVIALDDDGLLHAALSPLMSPPHGQAERVRQLVVACAPCDVLVVVEDLAPGGTDATTGRETCKEMVASAQATTLYATSGTVRLAPLKERDKGDSVDIGGAFLASAAWAVAVVEVPVVAVGRSAAAEGVLAAAAAATGLAGVVLVR